ncbi:MAG: hypothetical protein JWM85_1342 [Acidimicrobiaceae bacterium]|nr:hypothetical protein [Acidimicrobiaceae bacterium]
MLDQTIVTFPTSAYPPLALGFFGLGTGYLIYGPQELLGYPARTRPVDVGNGLWGIWMSGFMQFLAGTYLFAALVIFHSLSAPPLYMAALAFTAFGVHWFSLGMGRALGADARPNGYMCVAFFLISLLGVISFFSNHDDPVGILFIGLMCVYATEFFGSFGWQIAERMLGAVRILTGMWLIYLTFAVVLDFSNGYSLPT